MDKYEIRKDALARLVLNLGRGGIAAISKKSGIDASYVSRMLYPMDKKGAKNIGEDMAEKITSAFPEWLATGSGPVTSEASNVSAVDPARSVVPVISSVRAGTWGEINDHAPDSGEVFAVREAKVGPHAFALRVDGDSMTWDGLPSFPAGTTLIVDPDRSPKAGDYVIAKNSEKQGAGAVFKKLVTDGYVWRLKSLNRDFEPIDIDDPAIRVIGVVVEYWAGGRL
jgi:SOS-response transcriptional repressor LexA